MQNRRNFLLQTTLAAGSVVFAKPLMAAASSADSSNLSAEKLSILNLNSLDQRLKQTITPSLTTRLPWLFKNKNTNELLLSTGNILHSGYGSKDQLVKNLSWLKSAGCDAIVANNADLRNGFLHEDIENEYNLTVLAGQQANLPYHIVYKGNIKIGIIGNENYGATVKCDVEEIAAKLSKTAGFLKEHHDCNLVISMNPCNTSLKVCRKNEEKELAALTSNVDVIVSSNSTQKKPATYIVRNTLKHEVILNYQGSENPDLKRMDISFNHKNEKINFGLRKVG